MLDARITKDKVEAIVRDLQTLMPEGSKIVLGEGGRQDGIAYQSVKVLSDSGNLDQAALRGVRHVTEAFRGAGGSTAATQVAGGYEIRVLLDLF